MNASTLLLAEAPSELPAAFTGPDHAPGSSRRAAACRRGAGRASTGPRRPSRRAIARIFGMKESVCSWICVTAWKTETTRPTTRPTSRSGSATLNASCIASIARLMTTSWFIVEALHERPRDEVPAVDEDEQQDLERQRDEDGRQHHHAHAHQRRGDDQVDDQERQEDQEPDLERRLELGDRERGDEDVGRDVARASWRARASPAPRTARGPSTRVWSNMNSRIGASARLKATSGRCGSSAAARSPPC